MPPKKKQRKKKKEIGNAKELGMTLEHKTNYELKIGELTEELINISKLVEEKQVIEKEYREKYECEKQDKEDMVSYLNLVISENTKEIKTLEKRLEQLPIEQSIETENIKKETNAELENLNKEIEHTANVKVALEGSLANLSEIKMKKIHIEETIKNLEQLQHDNKEKHSKILQAFEKHLILDSDRIRKELVKRIEELTLEFGNVSDDMMADKIIQVIKENVKKKKYLRELGESTYQLLCRRDNLKLRITEMETKAKMEENCRNELISHYHEGKRLERIRKRYHKNLRELEYMEKLRNEHALLTNAIPSLKRTQDNMEKKITNLLYSVDELTMQIMNSERDIAKTVEQITELKIFMRKLFESIDKAVTVPPDDDEIKMDYKMKRQKMLKGLLDAFELAEELNDSNHYKNLILSKFEPSELAKQKTPYKPESDDASQPKYTKKPTFKHVVKKVSKQMSGPVYEVFKMNYKYPRSRIIRAERGLLSKAETIEAMEKLLRT